VVEGLTTAAGNAVDFLVDNALLPLVSIIVEPAKVLFLNNAINHGVFGPLGVDQAAQHGQSILFMIETNPGPGFGILLAFLLFGPKRVRPTVPGAMIIQFLGGIHEIYFPYILMKPKLILAAIAGGMAGVGTALVTHSGLLATPAPGSIFAYLAVTPRGGYVSVLLSIVVAATVSFLVGAALMKFGHDEDTSAAATPPAPEDTAADVEERVEHLGDAPVAGSAPVSTPAGGSVAAPSRPVISGKDVKTLVVACDAGMGSSVMLAGTLRKELKKLGIEVTHTPVNQIPADADIVICHVGLAQRAAVSAPDKVLIPFQVFLGDPAVTKMVATIKSGGTVHA
jgi:mannitol PTS system EIICBA or EIICB component